MTVETKLTHTPGPWRFDGDDRILSERLCVALVTSGVDDSERDGPVFQANARLIAAAPDLLEALTHLLELGRKDTSNQKYDGYYESAKAAIAKAEGHA